MTDEAEFSAARHAYEHAEHAADHPVHRLDVVDEPRWPRPPRAAPAPSADALHRTGERGVTHTLRIDSPARSAFKFGFGFAAGVWTFRALVLIVVWAILAVGVGSLLMRAFRF